MAFLSSHRTPSLTSIPVFCSSFPFWCPLLVPATGGVRLCPRGTWTLTFALGSPRVLLLVPLLPLPPFDSPQSSRGSSSSSKMAPSLLPSRSPVSLSLSPPPLPSLVVELLPVPLSNDSLDEVRLGRGLSGIRTVPVDVAFLADLDIWLREGTISLITDVKGAIGLSTWPRVKDHEALRECDLCCCSKGLTTAAVAPAPATLLPIPWGRPLVVGGDSSSIPTSRPPVAMASSLAVFIAGLHAATGTYSNTK